jgi:hypothetical protein
MRYALLLLAACGGATAPTTVSNVADVTSDRTLHAVLVIHPYSPLRAYVLGCTRGGVSVPNAECSKLLVDQELELVVGTTLTKVRASSSGRDTVCPADEPHEPYVLLTGRPFEFGTGQFVPASVASKHVALPSKEPDLGPPEPTSVFQVDLDGDGSYEIVMENLGKYTLYDQRGNELGSVGCVFG